MARRCITVCVLVLTLLASASTTYAQGCPEDIDHDGTVSVPDLLALLSAWGECPGCDEDIDNDGTVTTVDLLQLLSAWGTECPNILQRELVGVQLADYPFFTPVNAFNSNGPVHLAIDPTQLPSITGQTCDLYIVDARTADQWDADNTLADARPSGPQAHTFNGATIQANTVLLSNTTSLDADPGTDLGIAYDIVCDRNQNGVLDGDDIIDGYNNAADGRRVVHGLYMIHDITQNGDYNVVEISYDVPGWTGASGYQQHNTFYPSNIASLGQLPLIVVSRGNGHNYNWYDHIGVHLASYGYVVMSHNNHTEPGIETASTTTLLHTDTFLGQLANINGGILDGHIDSSRILWIGHSRGGEGVARAYKRLYDGDYTPTNYTIDDIKVVSSMAPTNYLGPQVTHPHSVHYHLWVGSADSDVSGCTVFDHRQSFQLHDRAEQYRQSIALHGVGHAWLHNGGGSSWAEGPCLIGEADTHDIQRPYLLALASHYLRSNVPAREFLWRQWEQFKPIGAPTSSCVDVTLMYREGDDVTHAVIDDFQSNSSAATSSSGGAVNWTVTSLLEGPLDDGNTDFTWSSGDPTNGMTVGGSGGDSAGVIFQWNSNAHYEQEIVPALADFSQANWLTFRAAQTTRHPNTTAQLDDVTFTVTLRDTSGNTSSINIGAYGGGIEEPYQRTGCGSGTGWGAEFEIIRMSLSDFTHNQPDLNLASVEAIRFDFGPSHGSTIGRIALDEIRLVKKAGPQTPGALTIDPITIPEIVEPGFETTVVIRVQAQDEDIIDNSVTLHVSINEGVWQEITMTPAGSDLYTAGIPAADCDQTVDFYVAASGSVSGNITLPADAPATTFTPIVGVEALRLDDNFETDLGWTTEILGATSGQWQRGVPVNDSGWDYDPVSDFDGSGSCQLTQNELGNTDVDGGSVRLTSPSFDLTGQQPSLSYAYYLYLSNEDGTDRILTEVSTNGLAGPWTEVASHSASGLLNWRTHTITAVDLTAAGVTPTANMHLRFTVNDGEPQSIVEAAIDAFKASVVECD